MATTLKEAVIENSKIEGACRVWTGNVTKRGRPIATYHSDTGAVMIDIQRYLAGKKFNLPSGKRVGITTTCGNPRCINSAHIEIAKIKRPRVKQFVRFDNKSRDVELNKQVFELVINHKKQDISDITGLSYYHISTILSNTVMLPFFQLKLEEYLGQELLMFLRSSDLSDRTIRKKYKLTSFALEFIKSGVSFDIRDDQEYITLLSQCFVMGDHLLWNGNVVNGTPVAPLVSGALRNARKMFVYSVTGQLPEHDPVCNCGFENCINPWHME